MNTILFGNHDLEETDCKFELKRNRYIYLEPDFPPPTFDLRSHISSWARSNLDRFADSNNDLNCKQVLFHKICIFDFMNKIQLIQGGDNSLEAVLEGSKKRLLQEAFPYMRIL